MGMYVSQDPIRLAGGILNLYGYVSDTNAWIDIFGLIKFETNDPDLFPVTGNQQNMVTIKMQGSRGRDFTAAYKEAGISRKSATGYTWHHNDDFNPIKGTCTMVLVRTEGRHKYESHTGAVKQFQNFMNKAVKGSKYDSREAVIFAQKRGWLTGRKPSTKKTAYQKPK